MASKTIEQDNDRRLTIMTATFIPCGAKLPVIALMGGVMQLITKIAVVAVGAWGMRNLDVVWLGWPASFVAGTVIPYFCFQKIVREMETE